MRGRAPFDRRSFGASLGVHVGLLVLVFGSSPSAVPPMDFVSYQIEIVSPPPLVQGAEDIPSQEELVVDRPEPEPPQEEEPRPAPVTEEKPKPKPPEPERRSNPLAEPGEGRKPGSSTTPASPAGVEGGEGINVRLEGVRKDYPEYYNNIIRQITRCFRWQGQGSWETTVYFVIHRDGKVSDMEVRQRSGNPAFDIEALGAVECAGAGRLGGLPEDLPWDMLPVQFRFSPQGRIRENVPEAVSTTQRETATRR
ncbi:MAG: TonB C-terminal domain-containing protein [Gemmatimonadetes bacterium]|nr:TonB C-terminal domain-containing protein [Gemmatimonadota bacterium]